MIIGNSKRINILICEILNISILCQTNCLQIIRKKMQLIIIISLQQLYYAMQTKLTYYQLNFDSKSIIHMKSRFLIFILVFLSAFHQLHCEQLIVPLAYAYDPTTQNKYPIKLSFNQSDTYIPFNANYIPLYNFNISMDTKRSSKNQSQQVIIGLKSPSTFISAVQQTFKVQSRQIQFGKEEYLQLIINGNNFVESRDSFVNGEMYGVKALYNFGDPLYKSDQKCFLIDDDKVYFDQFLILQILNSMQKKNNIRYMQDEPNNIIKLMDSIENFPKISFLLGKYIFEVQIKSDQINYIPRTNNSDSVTMIGYKAFKKFSKFQIEENSITFKRTSQLYQLYLFLGYFFVFTLAFILLSRVKLQQSMLFVRSVINWIVFHNRQARISVLRTQLQ